MIKCMYMCAYLYSNVQYYLINNVDITLEDKENLINYWVHMHIFNLGNVTN